VTTPDEIDARHVRKGRELMPGLYELDDCPPIMRVLTTPWGSAAVSALNAHQATPGHHPYTCVRHSSVALFATRDGWMCARKGCTYRQDWAWAAHALTPRP
jgi:hypothetical protein